MMWIVIGIIAAICCLFLLTIQIARKEGSKAAKLEALKAEIKRQAEEQRRYNALLDNVRNMSNDIVRNRLSDLSNDKR